MPTPPFAINDASLDLASVTDALNKSIARLESRLKSVSLGVEAWVPIDDHHQLGYGRINGNKWCLLIRSDVTGATCAMTDATRTQRALGVLKYLALEEELCRNARLLHDQINIAIQFVADLGLPQPEVGKICSKCFGPVGPTRPNSRMCHSCDHPEDKREEQQ